MQNFKPGTDVPMTFSLVDESGVVLTPTALRWRVLNEAEEELLTWQTIATMPSTSEVPILIPLAHTGLVSPALRGIRTVELEVTTAKSVVLLSDSIMLQGATALAFGVNSFQTYAQAILASEDLAVTQTSGWTASDRETREKAMIEAYNRIMLLPIGMHYDDAQSMLTVDTSFIGNFGPQMLRNMTPAQMLTLYPPLLVALRRAQVIETVEILNGDPVTAARNSGITGITVGESSQFFRATKPLDFPVCPRAMAVLQRWVRYGARIGRK